MLKKHFFTIKLFLDIIHPLTIDEIFDNSLDLLRKKQFIYNSYLYIELYNLVDSKGESSITTFINKWYKDILEEKGGFTKIFGSDISITSIINHFDKFKEWLKIENEKIIDIKYFRDKNFSHIDSIIDFKNNNDFNSIINIIIFLQNYVIELGNIIGMKTLIHSEFKKEISYLEEINIVSNEFFRAETLKYCEYILKNLSIKDEIKCEIIKNVNLSINYFFNNL